MAIDTLTLYTEFQGLAHTEGKVGDDHEKHGYQPRQHRIDTVVKVSLLQSSIFIF
jgi:hypothetical protein